MPFTAPPEELVEQPQSFRAPADEIVTPSPRNVSVIPIASPLITADPAVFRGDSGGFDTSDTDPFQARRNAKLARPADAVEAQLAPLVKTPEQAAQLNRLVTDKNTAPLPVSSTLGQATDAAFSAPKPFKDIVEIGRGIQQNNRDTTLALRAMAKKHGIDPDSAATLPSKLEQYLRGAGNTVVDTALSFTSPAGVTTLGFGGLPQTVQKAASLGFSAQMLSAYPDQVLELLAEENKPEGERNPQRIAELYLGALSSAGFGLAAGAHGTSKAEPVYSVDRTPTETLGHNESPKPVVNQPAPGFTAPPDEVIQPAQQNAAPQASIPPVGSAEVRTPDGQLDHVQTALNKMRAESDQISKPDQSSTTSQFDKKGDSTISSTPTIAERAATTPAKPVTMADLAQMKNELQAALSLNQIKPSEPPPIEEPAPVETSQPEAGTTVSPVSGPSNLGGELRSVPAGVNDAARLAELQRKNSASLTAPPESATKAAAAPVTDTVRTAGSDASSESQRGQFPAPPVTTEKGDMGVTAADGAKSVKSDWRKPLKLFGDMQGDAPTQGIGGGLASDRGDVSVYYKSARSGSDYVTLRDNNSGESVKIRYSNHFAPHGAGYRVNEYGSGREEPPDFNIVKNKIYSLEKGKWEQINLEKFRWHLENWLPKAPEKANAPVIEGVAGIKTPSETQSQRAEAQADKSGVAAWQPEGGSALTPETKSQTTESVKENANAIADKLESLKTGIGKGGQLHAFGLAADLWDRAVSIAQGVIRAGGSIAEAITAAIAHIKANHQGDFEEDKARFALTEKAQTEERAGDQPRPLDDVKSDFSDAEAKLKEAARPRTDISQKDYQQQAALAAARYRTVRDELKLHPDRVAEVLKETQRLSAAAKVARDAGNTDLARKLESEMQGHVDDLDRLPRKLVERVQNELISKGELPRMQEFPQNAGRTLKAMTDALNHSVSDSPQVSFLDRLNLAKKAADTYTAGKDALTKAWGNSVAASKALWSMFKAAPISEDFKQVMKSWIGYDTRTAIENANYTRALVAKVPQKVRRMAMSAWLDAGGDESLLRFQRDRVPDKYREIWDAALKLTPYEKQKAQEIKANFGQKLDDGMTVGIIGKGREDYGVPQRWKVAPQIDAGDISGEKQGKPGNPYAKLDPRDPFFSFQRNTPSYFDGIMAKGEPENLDIAHLVSVYDEAFHKALSSRGAIKALSEATARDGQPIVKISGNANIRTGDKPGVFVDSKSLPKDAVSADGRPYQSVDHWALRDWKFAAKDSNGNPIMLRGDMLVHPDYVDFLKNELNTPRWTTKEAKGVEKLGRYALQASSYLKASKFIGPFHIVTEALHAIFHGVVPTTKGFEINLDDPKQALLSRNMMIDMGRAREMYDDGIRSQGGGIWKHVPGLGDAIVRMNNFTFNDYIPKLKMKVGLAVLERNMARYSGKLTEDQIAEITGRQMDAAFGGQNWRLLGADKNMLAITRLGLVAPDFLISRAKVIGQAFRPYNNEQRMFLAAQAVGVYVLARILNAIFSDDHDPHFELKNWDSVVIGKRAYHARFILSDAANLARDLLGLGSFNQHGIPFITGRLGVLPKMGMEVAGGKDLFTGQNKEGLFATDNPLLKAFSIVAQDTAEWMTPMGVDGFLPGAAAKGVTGPGQALTALVGVSSRKESPANDVWDMARQFNLSSKDPATVAYQKQRDNDTGTPSVYRALNNLLDAGKLDKAKQEVQALQNQGKTLSQIVSHYQRNVYFTGRSDREQQFYASLTPAQRKQYQAAKTEQRERAGALMKVFSAK